MAKHAGRRAGRADAVCRSAIVDHHHDHNRCLGSSDFYVVQDTVTKKCTIVDKKPTTTSMVQVGPVAFKTRVEAESGMKTIKVCETNRSLL